MAAYVIANYTVTDPEGYEHYPQAVLPTLMQHRAEVLVSDYELDVLEGEPARILTVLKFGSKAEARSWYESEEYQAVRSMRADNSDGYVVLADEFELPIPG